MPATIFRQPPSLYRLDINHIFATSQDFIIFVKIKNQLRCFFITNKRLSLSFPFGLPTASTISCKIICSSRQLEIPGSHMITSTTSHSKIIVFKTCKLPYLYANIYLSICFPTCFNGVVCLLYIFSLIQITFIFFVYENNLIIVVQAQRKSHSRDRMVVGFIATYAINAYHI